MILAERPGGENLTKLEVWHEVKRRDLGELRMTQGNQRRLDPNAATCPTFSVSLSPEY